MQNNTYPQFNSCYDQLDAINALINNWLNDPRNSTPTGSSIWVKVHENYLKSLTDGTLVAQTVLEINSYLQSNYDDIDDLIDNAFEIATDHVTKIAQAVQELFKIKPIKISINSEILLHDEGTLFHLVGTDTSYIINTILYEA